MNIEILKDFSGLKKGEKYNNIDEFSAKSLIEKGVAKEIKTRKSTK